MSLDDKTVTQSGISAREKDIHDVTKSLPMEGVIVPEVTFKIMDDYVPPPKLASRPLSYYRYVEKTQEELYEQIEYDMDEEDCAWLELINEQRAKSNLAQVSMDAFEQLMDRFEKESFFQCQSEAKAPNPQTDDDAVCAVCLDGECYTNNVILFCDLCDLAVHQKCYGVPSIPDGSWVCQRCLLSPSKTVECCLCPNRRGAFKQTDDGRWVHVACALWLPEVDFANVTFLEPVVGINIVAAARWKLVCYICKQRSAGACVQCAHPSCYTGFHVTCAQQAGLTMAREHVKDAEQGALLLKKTTAFCDEHSESFAKKSSEKEDRNRSSGTGESTELNNQLALKKARKLLGENRNSCLPLFYPVITVSSIAKISRKMSIEQKEAFISRLHCYWTLKRQSRNGMPLLRSRQFGNFHRVVFKNMIQNESTKENFEHKVETKHLAVDGALTSKLKDCHRLRQDLEKVRLLIEQVRKREKLKVEQVKLYEQEVSLRLSPLMILFSRTLDKIDEVLQSLRLDSEKMECVKGPVQRSEFLLKMRQRVKNHDYRRLDAFEADLRSLGAMDSPKDGTERKSKELEELKQQGSAIISCLSIEFSQVGYDPQTGLHLPNLGSETTSRGSALSGTYEKHSSSARSESHETNVKSATSTKSATQPSQQTSSITRSRGRGKRKAPDTSTDASLNTSNLDGGADAELAESSGSPSKQMNNPLGSAEKSASSVAPSGVNRRTAVLFNNKTRKSAKHCDVSGTNAGTATKDSKPHRRPGRPPKQGGQRSDDGPGTRDRPFMLGTDCVGFGDRDLAERCGRRQNSTENPDFAKIIESAGGKGITSGDSVLEAATLSRQSFMQYRGGPQDSKSQKVSSALTRDGGEVSSRRSGESSSQAKESFLQYRNMSTSNSDVESHSDAESSSSSSGSETYCESTSSQDSSSESNAESMESDQAPVRGEGMQGQNLQSLDLVWAKCRGYPWYPALIIDPNTSSNDTYENGIPIPVPPDELLSLQKKHSRPMLLVLFFDAKRTWQWLPANKLQRLGDDSACDRAKLMDSKKPNIRRAVQNAYDKAIQHKKLVSTETANPSPQQTMDTA